jgi:uncharacterized protein YbjT (DUF2867 family)
MRALIAGGTGRLGTLVVQKLHARGVSVRVLTRDPRRCEHLTGFVDEVVIGDVRDAASLGPACEGVDVVVSAVQGFAGPGRVTPQSVDDRGNANLIHAAADAGASMVLVSVVGAASDHPMELFRAKAAAEARLRDARIPWTIVRASAFAELWIDILGKGVVPGRGANPINFVSVADVAEGVERAVLDPATRGQIINICGPENITLNDLAALAGKPRPRHIPRPFLRALGPFSRQVRAGLVMDTYDMTAPRLAR